MTVPAGAQPAKIASFTNGTRDEIRRKARNDRKNVGGFLYRNRVMEKWEVRLVRVADTWGDYEMWAVYSGDYASEREAKAARAATWPRVPTLKGCFTTETWRIRSAEPTA